METLKEFKGMLWGQRLNVYTDHKNLTRDGLGLTSDRVTHWRILLEEYTHKIIYIKRIHNTVTNAIFWLDYDPKVDLTNEYNHAKHGMSTKEMTSQRWLMFSKLWSSYTWLEMSAKCRRHVGDKAKCCQFLSRQAIFGDMVYSVSAHFCVAISRHWCTKDRQHMYVGKYIVLLLPTLPLRCRCLHCRHAAAAATAALLPSCRCRCRCRCQA